jgi:polyferredoxin
VGHQRKFRYKKQARWLSMLVGLGVLGFIYTSPLTLAFINKLLLGFWPAWQTHLYWYLLIGGMLFVFTVENKNPYCEWFCPFGAAQECMGVVGGAKARNPQRYRDLFKWSQRGLAWGAIVIALLLRNPGISSYEIFGTLFDLEGSVFLFTLLGIVLVAALFIKRPWCRYLCPLHPVEEIIRLFRGWVREIWRKVRPKTAA